MNGDTLTIVLLCFSIIIYFAIYWTLFKVRQDLNGFQEKINAHLSEIKNSLDKKTS